MKFHKSASIRKELNLNEKNVIFIFDNYRWTEVQDLIVSKKQTIIVQAKLFGGSEKDPGFNHQD